MAKELAGLSDADLVVVNGEGSIYGDEQKGLVTLFFCWYVSSVLNKRCYLINHTSNISSPRMRACAELVYPLLSGFNFRELDSIEHVNSVLGLSLEASIASEAFSPDAAFTLPVMSISETARALEALGCENIAALLDKEYVVLMGSSLLNRPSEDREFPVSDFVSLARALSQMCPVIVAASDLSEEESLSYVARQAGAEFLSVNVPFDVSGSVLAHSDCLIGGRWHPSILAAREGAPCVMFAANTTKSRALQALLDLEPTFYDPYCLDDYTEEIVDSVKGYIDQGPTIRSKIKGISQDFAALSLSRMRSLLEQNCQSADDSFSDQ